MIHNRLLTRAVSASLFAVLCGCGGGGSGGGVSSPTTGANPAPVARGRVQITVEWPEPGDSRLIPSLTNSITIDAAQGGESVGDGTITRPESSLELTDLPAGETVFTATAYPEDSPGRSRQATPLATATTTTTVVANQLVVVVLSLTSTIETVEVTPNPASVGLGQTTNLVATAKDGDGAVVLVPAVNPYNWQVTAGADKVSVDGNSGVVSGVAKGNGATVQATEVESGVAGNATVNVDAGNIDGTISDPFGAGIDGVAIAVVQNSTTVGTGTTGSDGTYQVNDIAPGAADVMASKDGFLGNTGSTTVLDEQTVTVDLTLQPDAVAVAATTYTQFLGFGGQARHRGALRPGRAARLDHAPAGPATTRGFLGGNDVDFNIQIVVLGPDGQPIPGLTANDFSFNPSNPDDTFTLYPDSFAYNETGGEDGVNVSTGLMLDTSTSAMLEDPSHLRMQAAKTFLNFDNGESGDQAALGAFATGGTLPTQPLTIFPELSPAFTFNGMSLFTSVDSLLGYEGGTSPVFDAMKEMLAFINSEAGGASRCLVVISDGADAGSRFDVGEVILRAYDYVISLGCVGLGLDANRRDMAEMAAKTYGPMVWARDPRQLIALSRGLTGILHQTAPYYSMAWNAQRSSGNFYSIRETLEISNVPGVGTLYAPFYVDFSGGPQ